MTASLLLVLAIHGSPVDTTFRLPRNGAVEIDSHLRDITLHIGAGDQVLVRGGRANLDGGTISIGDDNTPRHPGPSTGPIDVTVPPNARVEISTVGGNLTILGTPARLHAETVTGWIHVTGGSGVAEFETVGGDIVINDFKGTKLSVDATAGTVSVTNTSAVLNIDNVNGGIVLRGIRSETVTAETINSAVEFEGIFSPTGNYEFSSQNDNVILTLPGDVSARMHIATMHGQLRSPQIAATIAGAGSSQSRDNRGRDRNRDRHKEDAEEREITAVFGGGAARVSVDVFNGDVIVKKKM